MSDALRQALTTHAGELSRHVLDRMFENPFWMDRYGARGRAFADGTACTATSIRRWPPTMPRCSSDTPCGCARCS
ncbi:MAG: hypothetical protein R2712_13750 [Vicinamibacterales bacterium]